MTTSPNTTPTSTATALNSIIAADRLAFRASLDSYSKALRADWLVFEHRARLDTPVGRELGHTAATYWASFAEGLHDLREMKNAHPDLQAAARELLQLIPEFHPDWLDVHRCCRALQRLVTTCEKRDPILAQLLDEAWILSSVHSGNIWSTYREPYAEH